MMAPPPPLPPPLLPPRPRYDWPPPTRARTSEQPSSRTITARAAKTSRTILDLRPSFITTQYEACQVVRLDFLQSPADVYLTSLPGHAVTSIENQRWDSFPPLSIQREYGSTRAAALLLRRRDLRSTPNGARAEKDR